MAHAILADDLGDIRRSIRIIRMSGDQFFLDIDENTTVWQIMSAIKKRGMSESAIKSSLPTARSYQGASVYLLEFPACGSFAENSDASNATRNSTKGNCARCV